MGTRRKRWPTWKTASIGGLCVIAAAVLFLLSDYLDTLGLEETTDPNRHAVLTLPGFVLILGMALLMVALVCFISVGIRIREARIPPWERKRRSKRR